MMKAIQAVRGMRDITPEESGRWSTIEQSITNVFGRYGYSEIRMPLVETSTLSVSYTHLTLPTKRIV